MKWYTEEDHGVGTVKTCWSKVHARLSAVNPKLVQLMDECGQGDKEALYLLHFEFGELKSNRHGLNIPRFDGPGCHILNHKTDVNSPLYQDLAYGIEHSPLGMTLRGGFEHFSDFDHRVASKYLYRPGEFLGLMRSFGLTKKNKLSLNLIDPHLFDTCAGARSLYMTSPIGCQSRWNKVFSRQKLNIFAPKRSVDHAAVLTEIARLTYEQHKWRAVIVYFSEDLAKKILENPTFLPVREYISEEYNRIFESKLSADYVDALFAKLQAQCGLEPNMAVMEIIRHIIFVAAGISPGFEPLVDDRLGPVSIFQKFFMGNYLKKGLPTIMGPCMFDFRRAQSPCYVSIKIPSSILNSPSIRKDEKMVLHIQEIERYLRAILNVLRDPNGGYTDTVLHELATTLEFEFFHCRTTPGGTPRPGWELEQGDSRFLLSAAYHANPGDNFFEYEGEFFRGCVRIQRKHSIIVLDQ